MNRSIEITSKTPSVLNKLLLFIFQSYNSSFFILFIDIVVYLKIDDMASGLLMTALKRNSRLIWELSPAVSFFTPFEPLMSLS